MTQSDGTAMEQHRTQKSRDTLGSAAHRILVVDDEKAIRVGLCDYLKSCGYEAVAAADGDEALAIVKAGTKFELMLCDVRMPGISGMELVPMVLAVDADIAVIMLTGMADATTATSALTSGAMDYLTKPVDLRTLERAIERILRRRALLVEQRKVELMIREEVALRTHELMLERRAVQEMSVAAVQALVAAQEAKDVYLRGHSQRVADLAASIGNAMGLDDELVEDLRLAGRLHDIGKIGVRESVLNKPGPLTPEEYEHVKDSVRLSVEILAPLKHLSRILPYIQDHQERWNGTGYPRGLSAQDISIGGRILHLADAFDAMTSPRAFREAKLPQDAIAVLGEASGTQFDPGVLDAFTTVVKRRKSLVFLNVDTAAD